MTKYSLTAMQVSELKEAFSLYDKGGNGKIESKDLGVVIKSLGQYLTEFELHKMLNEVDNKEGTINFSEFLALITRRMNENTEDKLPDHLKVYEDEKDQMISAPELRDALKNLDEKLTDKEIDEIINDANTNNNGLINYGEFIKMMLSK